MVLFFIKRTRAKVSMLWGKFHWQPCQGLRLLTVRESLNEFVFTFLQLSWFRCATWCEVKGSQTLWLSF